MLFLQDEKLLWDGRRDLVWEGRFVEYLLQGGDIAVEICRPRNSQYLRCSFYTDQFPESFDRCGILRQNGCGIWSGSMRRNNRFTLNDLKVSEKVADGWLEEEIRVAAPLEAPA
jgi:hypothetical protein